MKVIFLSANQSLTKAYERQADGSIVKTPYPHVFNVTSIEEEVKDLKQFAEALVAHANKGNCLLKGLINRQLVNESRAGSTETQQNTEWVCLDVDGLASVTDVEQLLDKLGLSGISYIVQWSAGYGVENMHLRCHISMLLDKPLPAPVVKEWLIWMNLNVPVLYNEITLTRTGNTLRWPLDISTCQNDKLIYIATPVFKGGLKNPVPMNRIRYVRKAKAKLPLSQFTPSKAVNQEATAKRVNELRVAAGLPKRKDVYKPMMGGGEYLTKPDPATITDMKSERGFTYFNLNGGDSWAYFHPDDRPEYIYNFKNEPIYRTQELLPDYWKSIASTAAATAHQGAQKTTQGLIRLAFCDAKSSVYYRGSYDPATDHLELNAAKNETMLRDFAKQHAMPLGDFIPEWTYMFDPQSKVRVDTTAKLINTFQPSKYMRPAPKRQVKAPKLIMYIINHVLGDDEEIVDHFINWLACILQGRCRARTAWILHGTTATGKGVLMNHVLRPIFGPAHTTIRRMEELNEQYNAFMQQTFIVFVDEVQTKVLNNEKGVMAKLKNFITEPTITIRRMYANAVEVPNYTNWIFASNMPDPVAIDKEDRRFNVGRYQPNSIDLNDSDIPNVEAEVQQFHDYLMQYPADAQRAATPLNNTDREQLISISENSADSVSSALLEGNFDFFVDHLPTSDRLTDERQHRRIIEYKAALVSIIDRTQTRNNTAAVARDELFAIYEYLVGQMHQSPNKFTSFLKHHRVHMDRVWVNNKTVIGIRVTWQDTSKFKELRDQLAPPTSVPAKVIPLKRKAKK